MTIGNANFDAILSTTLANYANTFEDNVFTARPLLGWLKAKNRLKMISGGAKIVEQLMYGQNQASGSFQGYDTVPLTASAGLSAAEYPWRQFAATVAINDLEESQNTGEPELIDLLQTKIMQAQETMSEQLNIMFFSDGSGNSGKDWWGLKAFMAAYDITQNSQPVGNISLGITSVPLTGARASTNQWWQPYVDYGTGGPTSNQQVSINGVTQNVPLNFAPATQVATALSILDMTHVFNLAAKGSDKPDFGIMGQLVYEKYESLLQPQQRFMSPTAADGGFESLMFKTCALMFDVEMVDYATTASVNVNNLYFLNSKYINLKGDKRRWFTTTDFVKPANQMARYAQILAYGNLTTSNRMRSGALLNRF